MQAAEADFTLTFRGLAHAAEKVPPRAAGDHRLAAVSGAQRLARDPQSAAERAAGMRRVNPAFIPRNHRVEAALAAATETGDLEPLPSAARRRATALR